MKVRHGITALVTLIVMVFSLVGTAFASACIAVSPGALADSHVQHESMPEHSVPQPDSEPSVPNCPMGLAAGCVSAPSLASDAGITFVDAPELVVCLVDRSDVIDHIRHNTIFHPPRF